MKTCTKCNMSLPLTSFGKDKHKKDGFSSACRECHKKWYKANVDKRALNSFRWAERNRERISANSKKWSLKNKAKRISRNAKRRAAQLNASPPWMDEDLKFIINEAYELSNLRNEVTGIKWNVDHIIPLQGKNVCGLHVPWNLQVIPQKENFRKSNKLPTS